MNTKSTIIVKNSFTIKTLTTQYKITISMRDLQLLKSCFTILDKTFHNTLKNPIVDKRCIV